MLNPYLIYALLGWGIYSILYFAFKSLVCTMPLAPYFPLLGEGGLDLLAVMLSITCWIKVAERSVRNIFLIIAISFSFAFLADSAYELFLNLFKLSRFDSLKVILFELPFELFLLLQIASLGCILRMGSVSGTHSTLSYFPYAIASLLIFLIFVLGLSWNIDYLSVQGFFQTLDTLLEAVGFAFASITLARAKNLIVRLVTSGYLIILSTDFIIRTYVINGLMPYLSFFEMFWILGQVLICMGLVLAVKRRENFFELTAINSMQSKIALWMLSFWLGSAFLFLLSYYSLSSHQSSQLHSLSQSLVAILIPFSVLAIVCSNYIAGKISQSLFSLETAIDQLIVTRTDVGANAAINKQEIISEFVTLENYLFKSFEAYKDKQKVEIEFVNIAKQVVHDIRSPLAVINTMLVELGSAVGEKKALIKNAVKRINEIANSLLLRYKVGDASVSTQSFCDEELSAELMFSILNNITIEKQFEYSNRNLVINLSIAGHAYNAFAEIYIARFKRVLSNIINNAVEAISDMGVINLCLDCNNEELYIEIHDNGKGMSPDVLSNALSKGYTNKPTGAGLGLFHAQCEIENIKGKMSLSSEMNVGTTVRIALRRAEKPRWFCSSLVLTQISHIFILEKDDSIRDIWKNKLKNFLNLSINFFNSYRDILSSENFLMADLFIINYDMGEEYTDGIRFIKEFDLVSRSVLVTDLHEDKQIRAECETVSLKVLPRSFIPYLIIF